MAKTKTAAKKRYQTTDLDGVYLLKMVLYLVLGAQWLWFDQANGQRLPLPVGLLIGILFAMHDHFRIDRKIEYAVLLVAMLIGFVANIGIAISI
jgi:hypothetical protein